MGGSGVINITIRSFTDRLEASVKVQSGESAQTRSVTLSSNQTSLLSFPVAGEKEGEMPVIISLFDSEGGYQDAWVGSIEVVSQPSLQESILQPMMDFFGWLYEAIMSLFGS